MLGKIKERLGHKNEFFNAVNAWFLVTYLLIRLTDYNRLFASINRFPR